MIKKMLSLSAKTALALLASASLVAADAPKPGKGDPKKPDAAAAPDKPGTQKQVEQKADDAAHGLGAFGAILPLGQKNIDAKMPSFHDGKPSSLIHAGSMTRVDENHMDMEKVDIRLFGITEEADLRVQLITGCYDMDSQVLDSHQRSRVSRSDFQLEGDSMVFDTKTQQGKMEGHVHMIIFDASSLKKKPQSPKPAGTPGKDASPSASAAAPAPLHSAQAKPAKDQK